MIIRVEVFLLPISHILFNFNLSFNLVPSIQNPYSIKDFGVG
jgi:hypothetical protein